MLQCAHAVQMKAFVLVLLPLVKSILASNDAYFAKGWVPVSRSFLFNQMSDISFETRHGSGWKPYQGYDDSNIDSVKEDAIRIITPEQAQTIQNEKNVNAWSSNAGADASINDNSELKVLADSGQIQEKTKLLEDMQKYNVKTDINRRASKQIWDVSLIGDLIINDSTTPEPSIKTAETEISIYVKNTTHHDYEVTEPSAVQEMGQETNYLRNEYINKFVNLLSKYNIKHDDELNSYAMSKVRRDKRLYPSNMPSVSLPFRYNSLDHLPVDPLLAVLLSNYGYYLQGFYGLHNNYKNLYGYSASNNIHNNKPFGSYKIYSDTDSSN